MAGMDSIHGHKSAVMGAGAVGSYYGAMLARADADVTLIGRPSHVEAIARNGLLLETPSSRESVPIAATTDPAAVSGARWVLFCVKSIDSEDAARAIAPHLSPGAIVLSLQNGVDNVERVRPLIGSAAAIPAAVYVAVAIAAPGCVRYSGRGDLIIGEIPGSATSLTQELTNIAAFFGQAGIPVRISDNVEGELWIKLVMNCAYNAISALTRSNYGRLLATSYARDIMRDVVAEIQQLAAAKRIVIPIENLLDTVYRLADAMPEATSSTAQDIARGRRTEIDHLNGYVARQGELLGIATPVNRTLHALVKLLEQFAASPGQRGER
jgi:2-dehydropantoate 2-reductase